MSVIGSNILAGASGQGGDYTIARSLRFRSSASASLERTPSSASNRKTYTLSFWAKRGLLGNGTNTMYPYSVGTDRVQLRFTTADKLSFYEYNGSTTTFEFLTTQVFRDPSAWYHFVIAVDTTQATSSNRVKIYVNGVQITTFDTASYPSLNLDTFVNSTQTQYLGKGSGGGTNLFDGYMTEINFIDGQALTPSSFGANNASTGVWQPKKYAGTYGTNGFYLPFTSSQYGMSMFATTGTGFSTFAGRFVSGDPTGTQLNLPANSTNLAIGTGDFTVEGWVNTTVNGRGSFIGIGTANSAGSFSFFWEDNSTTYVRFGSTDVISAGLSLSSAGWVHLAVTRSGSTVRLYKNGSLVASGTSSANLNLTDIASIGGYAKTEASSYTLQGSLSNVRLVVGTALYTGSTYTVPTSALTAVSGTQLLALQNSTARDNSANNYTLTAVVPFVLDGSGNANDWQPNGINVVTAGSTYDSMTDVPTLTSATAANYCVINPLGNSVGNAPATLTEGNLKATNSATSYLGALGSIGLPTSGKFYWEVQLTQNSGGSNLSTFGIAPSTVPLTGNQANFANSVQWYVGNNTNIQLPSTGTVTAVSGGSTTSDLFQICYDGSTGKVYLGRNNTFYTSAGAGTGNPSSGTGETATLTVGDLYPWFFAYQEGATFNFGQRPFAYTPPTGFVALNTFNLPTPTIGATASTQANKYFDATLYTGNGSTQSIVNAAGFSPDLVWVKQRNGTGWHILTDSVRGANKQLYTNATNSEGSDTALISALNSNGFSVGYNGGTDVNGSGSSYVAWQWDANGTGSTNTAGSITSTVSANTSAGFSVVTFTSSSSTQSVGHGLGVAPAMIILKARSTTNNWGCYHKSLGNNYVINLNSTSAQINISNVWATSSTTFTPDQPNLIGSSGVTCVAYCFSEVAGYSKFGSYTGNGSSDGTFVYTGFRPKYIMVKSSSGAYDWIVWDSARNTYNVTNSKLSPNTSGAEFTDTSAVGVDFLSNGFKLRGTDNAVNTSSATYIYAAFAENPYKYSLAR